MFAPVLLGFDNPLVTEFGATGHLGDDVLRSCVEEVETRLVGADEHRAQITDYVTLVVHRHRGGARTILQIGQVPAGDIRLDQICGHRLDGTAFPIEGSIFREEQLRLRAPVTRSA